MTLTHPAGGPPPELPVLSPRPGAIGQRPTGAVRVALPFLATIPARAESQHLLPHRSRSTR